MKQPWEIYFDEFWLEFNRAVTRGDDGQRQLSVGQLSAIVNKVAVATAQSLVDSGWRIDDALELVRRLGQGLNRAATREDQEDLDVKSAFRSALRDAHTDYALEKRRLS